MKWIEREQVRRAWQTVRRNVLDPNRIRRLFTYNIALKILSLAIAFSIWFFVNFGERDTEETLKVPLELRNIPAHLMIASPTVDFTDLRVPCSDASTGTGWRSPWTWAACGRVRRCFGSTLIR
jgi:hypothetical protein